MPRQVCVVHATMRMSLVVELSLKQTLSCTPLVTAHSLTNVDPHLQWLNQAVINRKLTALDERLDLDAPQKVTGDLGALNEPLLFSWVGAKVLSPMNTLMVDSHDKIATIV